MKFNFNLNPLVKPLLLAGLITSAGMSVWAQSPAAGPENNPAPSVAAQPERGANPQHQRAESREQRMHQRGERMQERATKRMADLKVRLQITSGQESAWNSFADAMKPNPAAMQKMRAARTELQGLTTPERIDRMRAMRTERMAAMDQRMDATKTFYAQLNPLQQKSFDQIAAKRMDRDHWNQPSSGRGHRGHDGEHHRGERHERGHSAGERQQS